MRIAHVAPRGEQAWSGVLTVIVELATALARRGHEVDLWRLHVWADSSYRTLLSLLSAAGVELRDEAAEARPWKVGRIVAAGIERSGAHVAHLHGAYNVWNTTVSRALTVPYVFSPHSGYDPVSLRRSRVRKNLYHAAFEGAMLRGARACVGLTEAEAEHLRAQGAGGDVVVIPNGVAPIRTDIDGASLRRELGLGAGDLLAVFVGRLDVHRKGLDALVLAMVQVPQWHLALVGPDFRNGIRQLEGLIEEHSMGDRVWLLGARHGNHLHETYAAADLLVLPSRWEGLSMALLEGMAHGVPVLVSTPIEAALGIERAGAGWSAAHDELGPALARLSSLEEERWAQARFAAREFVKRFDWDEIAGRYERVYAAAGER